MSEQPPNSQPARTAPPSAATMAQQQHHNAGVIANFIKAAGQTELNGAMIMCAIYDHQTEEALLFHGACHLKSFLTTAAALIDAAERTLAEQPPFITPQTERDRRHLKSALQHIAAFGSGA